MKKSCSGCKAIIYKKYIGYFCELKKKIHIPDKKDGIQLFPIPEEECPKPRTNDRWLIELAKIHNKED